MAPLRYRLLFWSGLGSCVLACSENSGPNITELVVLTATFGPAADSDGYTLRIDAERSEPIGSIDTVIVSGLDTGEHEVELQRVASNCTVAGGGSRMVRTAADNRALVQFEIRCSETFGTLQVVTTTGGEDFDPSGYIARVSDVRELTVASTSAASTNLPIGTYQVLLDGIAPNCTLEGPNPRPVELSSGGVSRLEFTLHCSATTPGGRGQEIAFLRSEGRELRDELFVMNDDGTSVRPLPTIPERIQSTPNWLADGERLGFLAVDLDADVEGGTPYILTLSTRNFRPSIHRTEFEDISWSPDGERIAYEQSSCVFDCDGEIITFFLVVAAMEESSETLIRSDSFDYFNPAWLADGTGLVYLRVAEGLLEIVRSSADGSTPTVIGDNFAGQFSDIFDLAPSPDGSVVAFTGRPVNLESIQVFIVGMDGGDPVALTSGPSNSYDPTWSPDGRHIAFVSDRDGNNEIYVMEAGGANQLRITNNPAHDTEPAWRP